MQGLQMAWLIMLLSVLLRTSFFGLLDASGDASPLLSGPASHFVEIIR